VSPNDLYSLIKDFDTETFQNFGLSC